MYRLGEAQNRPVGEDEVRVGIVEGVGSYCPFLFGVCFWGTKNLLYMGNRRFQERIRLYLALLEAGDGTRTHE